MKRISNIIVVSFLLLVAPAAFGAAVDYYLKIEGIEGEATDPAHTGWIEILSFDYGAPPTGAHGTGGGGGTGKVSMQDFHFVMKTTKSTPKLMQACANGKHIPQVVISVRGERTLLRDVTLVPQQLGDGSVRFVGRFASRMPQGLAVAAHKVFPKVEYKGETRLLDNATFQFGNSPTEEPLALGKLKFLSPNQAMIVVQKGSRGHQILIGLLQARTKGKGTVKTKQPYMKIEFSDLLVSSYRSGAPANSPFESFSLNFTKVAGNQGDFQDVMYKAQ